VADGWCWFLLREEYCWLVAGGWFDVREKYCWLVADKPSEQGLKPLRQTITRGRFTLTVGKKTLVSQNRRGQESQPSPPRYVGFNATSSKPTAKIK
jgi:hypothetical protein